MRANEFAEPYQVPDANFGWSARDACYSYGSFVLDDDEALVVTHRPPRCRFWNLVVWNQFIATRAAISPSAGPRRRRPGPAGSAIGHPCRRADQGQRVAWPPLICVGWRCCGMMCLCIDDP